MSNKPGIGSHTAPKKGATDDWLTPPQLIADLGAFDLDPCVPNKMPWITARQMITEKECGLRNVWHKHQRVFMNPPYSKNMEFAKKFAEHKNGIALTFARTETAWFKNLYNADVFLLLPKRLTFYDLNGKPAKGNSGGPSVLIAYGRENVKALKKYRDAHGGLLLGKI